MFERFTDRARKVMVFANQEAQRFNHDEIGPVHVLIGLIKDGNGIAATAFQRMGVDLRKVRDHVEKTVPAVPDVVTIGKLPQTPATKKIIEQAMQEARDLSHNYVGTEHIAMGLLKTEDELALGALKACGVALQDLRADILLLLGHGEPSSEEHKIAIPMISAILDLIAKGNWVAVKGNKVLSLPLRPVDELEFI